MDPLIDIPKVNNQLTKMINMMSNLLSSVSDQVQHKPGCTATEDGKHRKKKFCYLCSENKGADQLGCYHSADLRLCF